MSKSTLLTVALSMTLVCSQSFGSFQQIPPSGRNLGSVSGGDFKKAHLIVDKKCTSCHSAKRIEEALAAGKNMLAIQHRMEQKGVRLSADEKDVLGVFWEHTPLKKRR